jgi:uncharacterized protein
MDVITGYLAAGLIGIALGLLGGGGSILTVPVLVYCFHIDPTLATAYSLFIVGATSLIGAVRSAISNQVDFKAAILFSIPAFIGVYGTRRYLLPVIPEVVYTCEYFVLTKNTSLMIFFALLTLCAGVSMIFRDEQPVNGGNHRIFSMLLKGLLLGAVTGIVGVGGGFLIVPALVLMAGVPMKKAVGTSLVVIAVKSLAGFVGDLGSGQKLDFAFMLVISLIAIAGIFLGRFLSGYFDSGRLRNIFGWFVVVMSFVVLANQIELIANH